MPLQGSKQFSVIWQSEQRRSRLCGACIGGSAAGTNLRTLPLLQPIVSLSLGCTAILLLGGRTRDEAPTAMYVRHGDAVVFTGETGHCARITCSQATWSTDQQTYAFFTHECFHNVWVGRRIGFDERHCAGVHAGPARMYYHGVPRVFDDGPACTGAGDADELTPAMRDFVRHSRINISIRRVS